MRSDMYSLLVAQGWMKSVTDLLGGEYRGVEKYTFDFDNILDLLNKAVRRKELSPETPAREIAEIIMNCYYGAVATWCITSGEASLLESIGRFCDYGLRTMIE